MIASDANARTMIKQRLGNKKIQNAMLELLAREFCGKHGRAGAA